MPLTPEQIARMDEISGYSAPKPRLTPEQIAKMDEISGWGQNAPQAAPAPEDKLKEGENLAPEGLGRTIFDQALQGATFGFADELSDRGGAALASLLTNEPYDVLLKEARETSQKKNERQWEQNPVTSMLSGLGGALVTGAAGAARKPGTLVHNSIRSGNLPARIAKTGLAGTASGAVYSYGSGQDINPTENLGRDALFGAGFGTAAPVVGKIANKLNNKVLYPVAEEIKLASRNLYDKAAQLGAQFSPKIIDDVVEEGIKHLPKGQTSGPLIGLDEADKFVNELAQKKGNSLTLDDFEELDKHWGDLAHTYFQDKPNLSRKFSALQGKLRESIENPANVVGSNEGINTHREATRLWSVSSKMRDIERIIEKASYHDNPQTIIKTGFRRIATNDKLLRGYTESEQKAIKHAAKTGRTEDLLKTFGSRLMSIAAAAVGGIPGAVAGYTASSLSRQGAVAIKKGQAGKVMKELGDRSGLVTKEQRIPTDKLSNPFRKKIPTERLKQIFKMKPRDAEQALKEFE